MDLFKRTWVQINLDAIGKNFEAVKAKLSPQVKTMAIVKADAYGHGFMQVVNEFCRAGCDWFGVSNLQEALQVRSICDKNIFILGYTPPKYAARLAINNISQAVFNADYARKLSEQAKADAVELGVHIKIDTGMTRLGFQYTDPLADSASIDEIARVCSLPNLRHEGIFTHFASADEGGSGIIYTRHQFSLFSDIISRLSARGVSFTLRHCCNSAATVLYPEMHLDMVRPGIILYGLHPSDETRTSISLSPCMELKSVVSMIKKIHTDTPVSYGRTCSVKNGSLLATLPVGYADGYPIGLSGKVDMLIAGRRAPVVGRICMDQCMLDVTDIPEVKEGDTVTVFGSDGDETVSVDALAARLGTISYELVCGISKRVPRVYIKGGKIISVTDYSMPV